MNKPNFECAHCGYSWHQEGIPTYCTNCYSREVRKVPSALGLKLEALREKVRKYRRKKEKMKGVTKLT